MLRQKLWNQALARYFSTGQGYNVNHSSQLRVVSTNQWPIPYYKRQNSIPRSLYPETEYNISMDGNETSAPDDTNVFLTQNFLNQYVWGREVLNTMQNLGIKSSLNTVINSPIRSADAYTEDLLRHIDFVSKENLRILKKHKLSELFD